MTYSNSNKSNVNWQPLVDKLNELFPNKNFKIELKENARRPDIYHNDLLYSTGIFIWLIKEVSVDFFNMSWSADEMEFWATIYINYTAHEGGSNGMKLMSVWYSAADGWKFELTAKPNN